jgi:hypothetical protein
MKAIVVIIVRMPDVKLPAEQSLAISISASLQGVAVVGADKSTTHNESASPFWTWFIENPRPHSSRSLRNLADLTPQT